jgi:hypothetical protein
MTQTGMQSDTYFTGKLYRKLDAYCLNSNGIMFYICSSNQYRTHKSFKQSILERHSFNEKAKIIIKKGE